MPPTFSLIVATRWRTRELSRLFDSLVAQTLKSFEVIVVDQNDDDRIEAVLQAYESRLSIRHISSKTWGHAAANNVGLALCSGDIVAFPDDDCWYAPDFFDRVARLFTDHPEWDVATGCEAASENAAFSRRFDDQAGAVTKRNIWRRHISFTNHFRREKLSGLFFDETLGTGAGTFWGSGEETDFLLQVMDCGSFVQYEPSLRVFHPDWGTGPYTSKSIAKAWRYAIGMGRVLQVHRFPALLTLMCFARPLGGGGLMLLRGKPAKALYHWSICAGRLTGWVASLLSIDGEPSPQAPQGAAGMSGR